MGRGSERVRKERWRRRGARARRIMRNRARDGLEWLLLGNSKGVQTITAYILYGN
jgi:hypothetical protein